MKDALARKTPSATPSRHRYDCIVLGGQLSGALTAALAARRGLHVLVVIHDVADGWYEHGGYRWPVAPGIFPPLKEESLFDECLNELGLHTTVQRMLRPLSPQVIDLGRFELAHDGEARDAELKRLNIDPAKLDSGLEKLHHGAKAADAFFDQELPLPPKGIIETWKTNRAIKRAVGLTDLPSLEDAPAPVAQLASLAILACFQAKPSSLSAGRAVARLAIEPKGFKGGRQGLRDTLYDRARELGADIVEGPATAVVFEGSKPVGVRLPKADTIYRGGCLIAACDAQPLAALMPDKPKKTVEAFSAKLKAERALFTHHAVVPLKALPRGLGELALLPAREALGPLVLQVGAGRKPNGEEVKERRLSIHCTAPVELRKNGPKALSALREQLWAQVDDALPFTRTHVLAESSVWSDCEAVAAGNLEPWPLYDNEDVFLGVGGLSAEGPLRRLFFASRQVLPGLGFEGEVLAARQACSQVERLLRKAPPLSSRRASK